MGVFPTCVVIPHLQHVNRAWRRKNTHKRQMICHNLLHSITFTPMMRTGRSISMVRVMAQGHYMCSQWFKEKYARYAIVFVCLIAGTVTPQFTRYNVFYCIHHTSTSKHAPVGWKTPSTCALHWYVCCVHRPGHPHHPCQECIAPIHAQVGRWASPHDSLSPFKTLYHC